MTWHSTELWEVVLDLIGLMLCGTTIIYLIRNKSQYRQILIKTAESEEREPPSFDSALIRSLNREERTLKAVPDEPDEEAPQQSVRFADERYGEVVRLADLGLATKDISKQTNIPKSEVELIVKLNKEAAVSNGKWP